MRTLRTPLAVLLTVLALGPIAASATPITIITSNTVAVARDSAVLGSDLQTDTGTTLNTTRTLTATHGASSNQTVIDWSGNAASATLDFAFTHVRAATQNSYAETFGSSVVFTAQTAATYTIGGTYAVQGDQRVFYRGFLRDLTTSVMLSQSFQQSTNTPNESFVYGGSGGDTTSLAIGSTTGNLIAGRNYQFFFDAFIQGFPNPGVGSTADGNIRLSIQSAATTVTEPGMLSLMLVGFAVPLVLTRRKRRPMA